MTLYKPADIELLNDKINQIKDQVERVRDKVFEPTFDQRIEATKLIMDYIKTNKRKIYGGFALNMLIKDKNPDDAIYSKFDTPDIDIYSPDPVTDLVNITNLLHETGKFGTVNGIEAQHSETYKVFIASTYNCCDVSYVPRHVFNKMPYKEIDGVNLIHPNFMMIDYLRMCTDPLNSYVFKMDKNINKFYLLQKYYPLPHNNRILEVEKSSGTRDYAIETIHKFLLKRDSIIIVGFYAFNHFLKESRILDNKADAKKYEYIRIPYYELVSTDYRNDAINLIDYLKTIFTKQDDITNVEHYPYFQFTGYSVRIYFENQLIAIIYDHNKRCHPYKEVPAIQFGTKYDNKDNSKYILKIGTFHLTMLYALISVMYYRTTESDNLKDLYYTFMSRLIDIRNYYLEKNKKTVLDESLFQEFVIKCLGHTLPPQQEFALQRERRIKAGKIIAFRYNPRSDSRPDTKAYIFKNSSGNPINKEKNLRLQGSADKNVDNTDDEIQELE